MLNVQLQRLLVAWTLPGKVKILPLTGKHLHITHLAAIFSTVGASKVFSVDRCLHGNAQREKFGSRGRHSSDLELQKDTVRIEYILNTLIFNEYNIYISLL